MLVIDAVLFHNWNCRVFVATWNVGGKSPSYDLNLQDFLLVEGSADIYILGYEPTQKQLFLRICFHSNHYYNY